MKYRLTIFDSDGTLADTLPWMRQIFNDLAGEHGFRKVADDEHDRFRELHGAALLQALDLPLWKVPKVALSVRQRMAERIQDFRLFPGIGDVLGHLARQGMRLAVVSSNSSANVKAILGRDVTQLISHFGCGASLMGKAAKLRAAVRASGIATSETIYIGDEIRDAEAARKAGLAFGAVAWGQHRLTTLQAIRPDEIFESVADLASLVEK